MVVETEPTRGGIETRALEVHEHDAHQLRGVARRPSHGIADAYHALRHRAAAELDLFAHSFPKSDPVRTMALVSFARDGELLAAVRGTTIALLILAPTVAVTGLLWWNALTTSASGLTRDRRVMAFFGVLAAITVVLAFSVVLSLL